MKPVKISVLILLISVFCLYSVSSYAACSVDEFGIKNIDTPENYLVCTRNTCDPELLDIITRSGFSKLDDWTQKVMEPGNYYVYAVNKNDLTKCMYLVCEKIDSPVTKDKLVSHKLAQDFNLAESVSEKSDLLEEMKRISATNEANWVTTDGVTDYIEYNSVMGQDQIHRYETIYNGNKITLQFSSKKKFSAEEKGMHYAMLKSLQHSEHADYAEINEMIKTAREKKIEKDTNTGKNTMILWYIMGGLVALVIGFAVYMAIRSQSKKRKKVIVLREHEVINDEENGIFAQNHGEKEGEE